MRVALVGITRVGHLRSTLADGLPRPLQRAVYRYRLEQEMWERYGIPPERFRRYVEAVRRMIAEVGEP